MCILCFYIVDEATDAEAAASCDEYIQLRRGNDRICISFVDTFCTATRTLVSDFHFKVLVVRYDPGNENIL